MEIRSKSSWVLERVVVGGLTRLDEGVTTIGRSPNCTITVASDYVSRIHAEFQVQQNSTSIQISDLGSTNGIFVNDNLYNRAVCRLNAGDRIGIGVSVDDDQVSSDGKYPIYILRYVPLSEAEAEDADVQIIPPSPPPSDVVPHNESDQVYISDSDYDEADCVDDFVHPQGSNNPRMESCSTAPQTSSFAPPAAASSSANVISENIRCIFGDINPELLNNLSKGNQEIAQQTPSVAVVASVAKDVIYISSDEECDENVRKPAKSPQLFDDSFENDEPHAIAQKGNKSVSEEPPIPVEPQLPRVEKDNNPVLGNANSLGVQQTDKPVVENTDLQGLLKVEYIDDNEDDELYFTQKLLQELREELPDSDNEDSGDYKVDECGSLIIAPVKIEKFTQNDSDIINQDGILDDDDYDDEFDELLESKVSGWSKKLFSQSFSNSFNASQVYEDEEDSSPAATTEGIFIDVDEYDDAKYEQKLRDEVRIKMEPLDDEPIVEQSVPSAPTPSTSAKENLLIESPLIRNRSSVARIASSSSSCSEEDINQAEVTKNYACSSSSLSKNHERDKHVRKLSITEEVPLKKPRLSSMPIENETEDTSIARLQRQSSSSSRTYSRSDSSSSGTRKSHSTAEDLFDKLKKYDKPPPSSDSLKRSNDKRKYKDNIDRSTAYRRSSSNTDETPETNYKSATVARRKSLNRPLSVEEEAQAEADDFEEIKKSDQAHATLTRQQSRGPPEIIAPPQLPRGKGKLRGVSAVQHQIADAIKKIHVQRDLKRKWLEKPDKRKEQAKTNALKQDRKQKLKELADKKKSDANNATNKNKNTHESNNRKTSKIRNVKITSVNRGSFLTEDAPNNNIKRYRIPKTSTSAKSPQAAQAAINEPAKKKSERKVSTPAPNSFSHELLKVDAIIQNAAKKPTPAPITTTASRDRQKSIDIATEQRERAPPRQSNKKLTFDAMKHHFDETTRLQNIQEKLAKASSMKSPLRGKQKRKTVRFNDVPEIRYIEPFLKATRKVDTKEPSTFNERKSFIRSQFPIADHTDELLSDVLSWSQNWLQNKHASYHMDGSDNMIFPMTNKFTSINNYKSTLFPLLKIEYLSHLERHMQQDSSKPGYSIRIDYFTKYKDREIMFAKCSVPIKQSELGVYDLALIKVVTGSVTSQCFGYIGNIRKTDSCNCITVEVVHNSFPKENLKNATHISIRRILESIRAYFGSFNAVHQLEKTPLFHKILDPLDLLNVKTNFKPSIQYKGCDSLNAEQTDILLKTYAKAIDEHNPNITLIKGPPGTGKSRLITNLALQLLYGNEVRMLDKKILICAQSNMAVDVIAQQLRHIQKKLSARAPKYHVIRYGKEDKVHKDVKDITLSRLIASDRKARLQERQNSLDEHTTLGENLKNEILKMEARIAELQKEKAPDVRQDELVEMKKSLALKKSIQNQSLRPEDEKRLFGLYLENANIICTTLSSCVKLSNYVNYFDICIIDEATQCIEPWTIMPLKFGVNSLIMVGDTQQLPATVISQKAKEYGLGTSLFTRIQNCLENSDSRQPSPILSLHTQYRMHPEICKWPNMYFYKNELFNDPSTDEFKSKIKPFSILNLEYKQNDHCHNGQIANSREAEFVTKLVTALNAYIPNKFFSYGVITPYAQHREKLEGMLRNTGLQNVMVNTIDSYQGIEKDVIIISNARTQGVGFLGNYQRLNVALTRPKKCLILCGNFKNLELVPSWSSLLANARERNLYHDISNVDASDIDKNVINKIKLTK